MGRFLWIMGRHTLITWALKSREPSLPEGVTKGSGSERFDVERTQRVVTSSEDGARGLSQGTRVLIQEVGKARKYTLR